MTDHSHQDRLSGTLLDRRYRIQRRLATGGTASVYVGVDERLDRSVALKIFHGHYADDPKFVERAQREAKGAARLHHPNVVAVLDQGHTEDGVVYLVLEYVDGPTLRQVIARESPMTARRTLELLVPVLRGLAQAHRYGMVHRDMKPENVLLTTGWDVKVADFGLMRAVDEHTATSTILGTVAYAAPELVGHEPVDQRCDVYAVGIMTYEMLTGSRPYTGTALQVANSHVSRDVPAPSRTSHGIPGSLDEFVLRCTARDPQARPADATALLDLALAIQRSLPSVIDPVSLDQPTDLMPPSDETRALPPSAPAYRPVPAAGILPRDDLDATRTVAITAAGSTAHRTPDQPRITLNPQPEPLHLAIGAVVFVLSLALAGFLGWWLASGPGTTAATVPDVSGSSVATAERTLDGAGISNVGVHTTTNAQVPAGSVIATDPGASSQVRGLEQVVLLVSEGPAQVDVPLVEGMSLDEARDAITRAGFSVGAVQPRFSEEPEGTVVEQQPASGSSAEEGSVVDLTVALAGPTEPAPNVVGQNVDSARESLEQRGFTVEVNRPVGSTLDRVVHQREDGDTVILTVI
ncbi:Stk1 family PASTA domain-containing Ser/Thr kinase [Kocuria sp. cx-116]|uniref:Stk1 family PASTA domain-containing Ser/Thr kinase n=1 Tax=Kocuria sp. cx-116 TaxID=2771378 RepID=UPI001CC23A11|nr:Stk1 family PASTA domain-containing Ser/Thr kinase [Kocuria sp. cx-116]